MKANPLSLWYAKPAANWNEALALGNGRLGAMAFSGVDEELFQLNEDTLWGGRPHNYIAPNAGKDLAQIRELIFSGHEPEAEKLLWQSLLGSPVLQQAYQPLGDLKVSQVGAPVTTDYTRSLDLMDGILRSGYRLTDGGIPAVVSRETFISHPHQVIVHRIKSDQTTSLNFTIELTTPHHHDLKIDEKGRIEVHGQWIGTGKDAGLQAGVEGAGLRFSIGLALLVEGGHVEPTANGLVVANATECTIILGAGTSFVNYQRIDGDPDAHWRHAIEQAVEIGFDELRAAHVRDFRAHMGRVELDLGGTEAADYPTNERLGRLREGQSDPALVALYAQFGRYLLLSSSRPHTQPANLQGIWNKDMVPAWGSKWTTNINAQMNYWAAEEANLAECHEPLFDLLDDLRVTGAATAQAYYKCAGWVLHHNSDLWRGAAAVDGSWGVWPMGSAWMARHPWEHYEYSGDEKFLRDRAWPIMKGAAEFILDFLIEAPKGSRFEGHLVTNPSHSPENNFRKPDGKTASLTYAATMDLMIVHDLFANCRAAIEVLGHGKAGFEAVLVKRIKHAQEHLAPLQIDGRTHRLQEWIEPFAEPEPGHRHMSHLFGLHPGHQIGVRKSPDLAQAVENSLNFRLASGGGGTGWSRAWVTCFFARLEKGDKALEHLKFLLTKSTLPNLFDNHPPFQIDGNFGGCSAILEMLLQSHLGEIHLLPALPAEWSTGHVRGLRARGGFEADVEWKEGQLVSARLKGRRGSKCDVRYAGQVITVDHSRNVTVIGWNRTTQKLEINSGA